MSSDTSGNRNAPNPFTSRPLPGLFARTALPVIFMMSMNGLLTIVDAIFLGHYVGSQALAAVTVIFPLSMVIIALSTLVSAGLSSELARKLGAGSTTEAQRLFTGAHGLSLLVSACLIIIFLLIGETVVSWITSDNATLSAMSFTYLQISIFASPVMFLLSLHADALRNEGKTMLMAAMSLGVSLANILFNYVLIVIFEMGVAGSALGTLAAQGLALVMIVMVRTFGVTQLRPRHLLKPYWHYGWLDILKLGAPSSLGFFGMSLVSSATIVALQVSHTEQFPHTMSAYGIITRIMAFYFLPLLGLSQALQSVIGNNYGARFFARTNRGMAIAITISFLYCLIAQIGLNSFAAPIGRLFVSDQIVVSEVVRILPLMTMLMFIAGPTMMIATFFQAIGDAPRAAILSLSKAYLFMLPLLFGLPAMVGETGIWLSNPVGELLLVATATLLLYGSAKASNRKWGLFFKEMESTQ